MHSRSRPYSADQIIERVVIGGFAQIGGIVKRQEPMLMRYLGLKVFKAAILNQRFSFMTPRSLWFIVIGRLGTVIAPGAAFGSATILPSFPAEESQAAGDPIGICLGLLVSQDEEAVL